MGLNSAPYHHSSLCEQTVYLKVSHNVATHPRNGWASAYLPPQASGGASVKRRADEGAGGTAMSGARMANHADYDQEDEEAWIDIDR
jgi:hypothetical protein